MRGAGLFCKLGSPTGDLTLGDKIRCTRTTPANRV